MSNGEPGRFNVLMIADHDLGTTLGCYGKEVVQSPNLDRLAERGISFQNHFCAYPLCGPSRASLLTGRRPESTRVYNNNVWFRHTMPEVITLPAYFKKHGYWTGTVGPVFHSGRDDPEAWCEGGEAYRRPEPVDRDEYKAHADRYEPWDEAPQNLQDAQTAERAIELLETHAGDPFFIATGFHRPHVPLTAPQVFFDRYVLDDIPLPPQPPPDAPPVPEHAHRRQRWDLFMDRRWTEREARQAILAYYACVTFLDEQVGKILDAVDRLNLWKDTVVVYWVDHGFHMGEHDDWGKSTLFDSSVRVACIMAAPNVAHPGQPTVRLTEHVDLYPTLVELCGLPMPEGLEGTSFVPLLSDPDRPWKRAAFSTCPGNEGKDGRMPMGRMARTEQWQYNRWGYTGQEELYDMEADPNQLINLAQASSHSAQLMAMRQVLDEGWEACQPER